MELLTTTIKSIGSQAHMFEEENMLILFGDNAPDDLKDFCYIIDVKPLASEIETGMTLSIDNQAYTITAVGDVVTKNLSDLGHITIKFDGKTAADLPGTLHVKGAAFPVIEAGATLTIS